MTGADAKYGQAISPPEGLPSHDPRGEMKWRRQRRAHQPRGTSLAIDDADGELRLQVNGRLSADPAQKPERLVVAAEEDVLTVVHALARGGVGERRGAPAERRPRFQHEHAHSALGKRRPSAQTGETRRLRR